MVIHWGCVSRSCYELHLTVAIEDKNKGPGAPWGREDLGSKQDGRVYGLRPRSTHSPPSIQLREYSP